MPDYVTRDSVLAILRNRYADATDWEHRILERLAHDVRDLPAEDVETVRHGEWYVCIVDDDEWDKYGLFRKRVFCSACGVWNTHGASRYCPHCGAKMDGGAENG